MLAPQTAVAAESADLTESERAQQQAAASGERVEVVGERTERETVFANPDGNTFTLRKSIVPVRVEKPGGGWTAPDATLVKRADGSVGPKAAAVGLSFSGGGDGTDLVTIAEDGQSVTLGWPGKLPEPRLEGTRAVYEDVRPDVNLILTATVEGFRQVLEVETLQAAKDPALASLKYSMDVEGLRVRAGAAGSMEAVDGNGQVVFRSPSARMWNSAGQAEDGEGVSAQGLAVRPLARSAADGTPAVASSEETSAPASPEDTSAATAEEPPAAKASATPAEERPAGPAEEGDPLAGPGVGDEAAVMDVDVTPTQVTVTPDAGLIADTTSAELPLYIDPSVEMNESERTVLSSDGDSFYNFSGGDNGMSVGRCGSAVIGGVRYYCTSGSAYTNRMYFEFTPGKLKGKHVLDATFAVTETWSFSCDARWVDLERTDGISSSSKWPGPGGPKSDNSWDQMGDRYVSAGRGSACSPSQPRAPIEFNDNPDEADENLTSTVRAFADGKFKTLTLMLKAKDESDPIAWKRFDDDAVIDVTYVGKPAVPTEYGLETGTNQICSKSSTAPTTWSDPTPNLAATPQTVAGGEASASLRVYFDLDVKNTDGTWSDAKEPSTGSMSPSGYTGDGVDQNKTWDAPLTDGKQYRYRSWTRSYYNSGNSDLGGPASPFCYFTVDSSAPKPPTVTFNTTYKECVPGACTPSGAPGKAGTVTFGPSAGDTNTAYAYKLSTDTAWRPWKSGATVTETVTPVDSGTITLEVMAKDSLGRTGQNKVRFLVDEGDGPVGRWTFNEASGAAVDVSAGTTTSLRDDATLSGATRVNTGRRGVVTENGVTGEDKALKVGGTSYAATAGKVLETQASYTVSAWVRLDSTSTTSTVLGQDGTYYSPFFLGYCSAVNRWCLRLADADAATTSLDNQRVNSLDAPQAKVWTHLAAVVDTTAKTLTLYVNGVPQGTDTLTTGNWSATGPLQIGRVKYKGGYVDHFPGEVDEVTVWQDIKLPEAMAREANPTDTAGKAYAELVAQYAPEGATGTTLTDTSGYGNTLTLSASGASLDGEALVLDGTAGAATAARSPVSDTGSFTVATLADVDTKALGAKPDGYRAQVLGQRTATGSSWSLWVEKTGTESEPVLDDDGNPVLDDNGVPVTRTVPKARWHFGRLTADGSGTSVVSDEDAVLDSEVGLVGAYNAHTREITLFVGSTRQGDPLAYTASAGSGEFAAGKGFTDSAWAHHLPGRITDIRLWAGAVTDPTQVEELVGY
ncbi:laminin G domain-containing protein [Streptomyces aurantiogriseus]|uniref:laminin G domain-containing protein n=1 Tax=Streptomyces aurantiogriseus TaxID=66870 RepID=UPI001E61974A|nr:laminin G domain-containing protein [Streptomyces aurantiogriseus]